MGEAENIGSFLVFLWGIGSWSGADLSEARELFPNKPNWSLGAFYEPGRPHKNLGRRKTLMIIFHNFGHQALAKLLQVLIITIPEVSI